MLWLLVVQLLWSSLRRPAPWYLYLLLLVVQTSCTGEPRSWLLPYLRFWWMGRQLFLLGKCLLRFTSSKRLEQDCDFRNRTPKYWKPSQLWPLICISWSYHLRDLIFGKSWQNEHFDLLYCVRMVVHWIQKVIIKLFDILFVI